MSESVKVIITKLRKALAQLPYLPRALALVWAASRGWTVAWLALLALQGLLPVATVTLTRALVNSLVAVMGSGSDWITLRPVLLLALLMGGILLTGQLLSSATGWMRTAQGEAVMDHVSALVHRQCVRLDLAFYDSAAYFDRLHRARAQARYRPLSLVESLGGLLQNSITLAAMAAVLLPYGDWLPVALLASTLPALAIALHYRSREHRYQRHITADERRVWYYDWLLTARQAAAEIRLFGLGNRFRAAYQALRRRLRRERLRLNRDEGLAQLAAGSLALLVTGGVMAWMAWRAIQGQATLGDLALFYAAFNQGQGLMRAILGDLGNIYGNSLFLGDLFEFLALEPGVVDPAVPVPLSSLPQSLPGGVRSGPAIRFRDVSFAYPGSRRQALSGLNLDVPAGTVAAIVGPNGVGKSTLLKLLCRFYDPDSGSIEVDGVDLRRFSLRELRQNITVLFQEPVHYAATVAENIEMSLAKGKGRLPLPLGEGRGEGEAKAEVERAARAAGAEVMIGHLPKGYDTVLGTWFEGGTGLSVGEWQRIALARAFLRQAPIMVLDEPTSAMDSWAEADWLRRFCLLARGHTAMVITHRFTTAMVADVIHVMHDGRIVESGSHQDLLTQGGRYAQSWTAQMRGAEGQGSKRTEERRGSGVQSEGKSRPAGPASGG